MHHVELLLDASADAAVRAEWRLLAGDGLPSLAGHRSPSNRPHVTVTTTRQWPADDELPGVLEPLAALPVACRLGAPLVFGRGPFVLARSVVATETLLALHREVVSRFGAPASDLVRPGRWVPHVTLAHRLGAAQVAQALDVLGPEPGEVALVAARHWDSEARLDEALTGA